MSRLMGLRHTPKWIAIAAVIGFGSLGPATSGAQDFDEDDAYDQAFPVDPGGPIVDPPVGGPSVGGEAVGIGDMPVGGPMVGGEAVGVGDGPIGGPSVGGEAVGVGDAPIGGPSVGGGAVGDPPVEGEPLY